MSQTVTITEADILSEVVSPDEPNLSPELAQSLLGLRLSDKADRRIRRLLGKNNRGAITQAQRSELEKYLRVG